MDGGWGDDGQERGGGSGEDSKWSAWQIAGQPNEVHHYFGSCDNFLRPDGTICYPRGLILAGSCSFQTARIKNAMMTWWYGLQPVRATLLMLPATLLTLQNNSVIQNRCSKKSLTKAFHCVFLDWMCALLCCLCPSIIFPFILDVLKASYICCAVNRCAGHTG